MIVNWRSSGVNVHADVPFEQPEEDAAVRAVVGRARGGTCGSFLSIANRHLYVEKRNVLLPATRCSNFLPDCSLHKDTTGGLSRLNTRPRN